MKYFLLCTFFAIVLSALPPDVYRNFTEIVQNQGYPCEEHEVLTPDGYILGVFRIPHGKGKPPGQKVVLLFHGLLDSSFTWIINMPSQSLAYILADAGYDVWMGNVRGNIYSLKHERLTPSQEAFWQFSFDEFAMYDLPSTINYILKVTNRTSLNYVGHSEGTTQLFAAFTFYPQMASSLNLFVAMGPAVFLKYETNLFLRILADLDIATIIEILGFGEFLVNSEIINKLGPYLCVFEPEICDVVIELICGKHQGAFNDSRMPVIASHEPGGTSVKNIAHWAQMIKDNKFQMYDYGTVENLVHYHQSTPPQYSLSSYPKDLPLAIFHGGVDELADPLDVRILISELPVPPVFIKELPNYAHLDFCWDYTANVDFYEDVLHFLSLYSK